MIAERIQQSYTDTKYYQFATILEHVIDCFHTIVTDETNPYHPPLAWLTRKQPKRYDDELFLDLYYECCNQSKLNYSIDLTSSEIDNNDLKLSSSIRSRLERCSKDVRRDIVNRTKDGCSPLFMACKLGLTSIAKYLLDVCEANIEQTGQYDVLEDHHIHSVSPIWVAAVRGNFDTVKLLIERGANINSLSDTGSTPLRSVCFLCKEDDVHIGSDSSPTNDDDDIYIRIVRLLVENGASVTEPNFNGGNCLINSLHNCELLNYIIDHGAHVDAHDFQSKTALHYAIHQGRISATKLLLSRGANPYLFTTSNDDALQLACIGGHIDIFEHLITNFHYPSERLIDAFKLIGSSILEIHYDLPKVRELWKTSLMIEAGVVSINRIGFMDRDSGTPLRGQFTQEQMPGGAVDESNSLNKQCDRRRSKAYGDMIEFSSELELQTFSADDFRIQSLIISERVLGSNHRETIQRLLYRGTFYINSLRPGRCIDLWIYALKLRLTNDSMFHFESMFAAQAITRLFLDLFGQQQQYEIKFCDVYDVLELLVDKLEDCKHHLSWKPTSCVHEDIFDLILEIIVNLLLVLMYVARGSNEGFKTVEQLVEELVRIDPRCKNGSSLLHVCVGPNIFDGDTGKLVTMMMETATSTIETSTSSDDERAAFATADGDALLMGNRSPNRCQHRRQTRESPLVKLIGLLIDKGLDIDITNNDGLSALQVLCLASIRGADKTKIIRYLVRKGAHIDRKTLTPEQAELIRSCLRESGVNPFDYVTLSCLAARKLAHMKIELEDKKSLTKNMRELIEKH